jgi:hypothetical protein
MLPPGQISVYSTYTTKISNLQTQAFLRAQVLDPNYPLAWLGQGLVASVHGRRE